MVAIDINDKTVKDLTEIMEEIKVKGGLFGAILGTHDGEILANNADENFDWHQVSAMCASALNSAVGLGETIGDRQTKSITVELEDKIIIVAPCEPKLFIALLVQKKTAKKVATVLSELEAYASKIEKRIQQSSVEI